MDDRIIRMKLDTIRRSAVMGRWPIGPWQARTADFLAPGEYRFDGDWAEIAGESFWSAGKTLFIRATAETPPGVPAESLFLQFDAEGLEGLLTVDGRPYAGVDANHLRVVVPHNGRLELEAEFVCLLAALHRPELRRERGRLREVAFLNSGLRITLNDERDAQALECAVEGDGEGPDADPAPEAAAAAPPALDPVAGGGPRRRRGRGVGARVGPPRRVAAPIGRHIARRPAGQLVCAGAGVVGLISDLFNVVSKVRLMLHVLISALLVIFFAGSMRLPGEIAVIPVGLLLILFLTGSANIYNFMDGINGIAGIMAIVSFGGFTKSFYVDQKDSLTGLLKLR
ncbi:MAG: hypothetical protein WCK89_09035 [bacterium]